LEDITGQLFPAVSFQQKPRCGQSKVSVNFGPVVGRTGRLFKYKAVELEVENLAAEDGADPGPSS